MKIEIVSQKKNPLMAREEVEMRISHQGQRTPTREEILKEVARALKTNEMNIIIDKIFTLHGQAVSSAKVLAYEKKEDVPVYKIDKMKRRMKAVESKPPSAKADEEKAAA